MASSSEKCCDRTEENQTCKDRINIKNCTKRDWLSRKPRVEFKEDFSSPGKIGGHLKVSKHPQNQLFIGKCFLDLMIYSQPRVYQLRVIKKTILDFGGVMTHKTGRRLPITIFSINLLGSQVSKMSLCMIVNLIQAIGWGLHNRSSTQMERYYQSRVCFRKNENSGVVFETNHNLVDSIRSESYLQFSTTT